MTTDDLMDMVMDLKRRVERLEGNPAATRRFKPPTIEEVATRMAQRNLTTFTAEAFFAYYESVGWRIGNKPMKSWDAALTTWANREHSAPTKLPSNKFIKFYTHNDICLMAQTNDNVWSEYVALQLPDRPRPVWAHINDVASNNLTQYKR